jgi:hypothetical protein
LINGVRDIKQLAFLAELEQIDQLVPLLRSGRLDMFADGFQDWIGLDETRLVGGRRKSEALTGECHVERLVQGDNGAPAALVIGQASKHGSLIPKTLVIVDPTGVVRGLARSYTLSPVVSRVFYRGKFSQNGFVGYIHDYNPRLEYVARSADGVLSNEKIHVQIPTTSDAQL